MVHKATFMLGCHLVASDGTIGHVDDLLLDEHQWGMRYLVVDTSNWIGGRHVLVASTAIARFDPGQKLITVTMTREAIKQAPSIEAADLPLVETLPVVWIM